MVIFPCFSPARCFIHRLVRRRHREGRCVSWVKNEVTGKPRLFRKHETLFA